MAKISSKENFTELNKKLSALNRARKKEYKAETVAERMKQKNRYAKSNVYRSYGAYKLLPYKSVSPNLTYRYSIVLTESVNREILTHTLYDTTLRFPAMRLDVREGFFSFYTEDTGIVPILHTDDGETAKIFDNEKNYLLFKLSFYRKRITADICSDIGDFTLCKDFIECVLQHYLETKYAVKFPPRVAAHYADAPRSGELLNPYDGLIAKELTESPGPYMKIAPNEDLGVTNLISFEIKTEELNVFLKEHQWSEEEYFFNLLKDSLQSAYSPLGAKPLIGYLKNMRTYHKTPSYKNFTLCDTLYEFDNSAQRADKALSRLIRSGKKVKYLPMIFKKLFSKKDKVTAYFAPAGVVSDMTPYRDYVIRAESALGCKNAICLSYVSALGKTVLTFTTKLDETKLEYEFYKRLSKNFKILVDTNRRNNIL